MNTEGEGDEPTRTLFDHLTDGVDPKDPAISVEPDGSRNLLVSTDPIIGQFMRGEPTIFD